MSHTFRRMQYGALCARVHSRRYLGRVTTLDKTHTDVIHQIQCGQVVKKPYQEYIVPSSSGVMVRHRRFTVPAQSNCNRAIHTHLAPLSLTPYCQGITAIAAPENYRAKTETSKTPEDNNSKSPEEEVITGARVLKSFEDNDVIVKKREMHNVPWESLKNKSGEELDQLLDRWDSRQIVKKVARKEIQHTNTLSPYEHQIETLLELLGLHNKPPKFSAVLKNDYPKETSTSFQPVFWSESAESGFHQAVAKSSVHHNNLPGIFHCAVEETPPKQPQPHDSKVPTTDQLNAMKDYFVEEVEKIFKAKHEYGFYTKDVVFHNNYSGTSQVSHGVQALVFQVAKLRAKVNWRFMSYGMQVLGATVNEKEGSFCLHFRLSGVPFKWRRALQFWKWMPWSYKKSSNHSAEIYEGLITFYANEKERVYKVKLDKVVIDPYQETAKNPSLVEKLVGNTAPV